MKPMHLSIWTRGILRAKEINRPSPVLPAQDPPTIYGGSLFSPTHWADDGFVLTAKEIEYTRDELRDSIVPSNTFGKRTFSGIIPSDLDIEDFLEYTACYDLDNARWRNTPRRCRSVKELFKPMRDLVFAVFDYFRYTHSAAIDSFNLLTDSLEHNMKVLPHFMGLGRGSNFGPLPCGFESGPSYAACTSFLDLQIEDNRHPDNDALQLALYARQCFRRQANRRFVYGLLVTEKNFVLYVFDRSGVCYSLPWDIHRHPVQFIRVLLGIWSPNYDLIGFDTSIYWEQDHLGDWRRFMNSVDSSGNYTRYRLDPPNPVFASWEVVGRGTRCWRTRDKHGRKLLIKEAWRNVEHSREADFLKVAVGLEGVGQLIANEEGPYVSQLREAEVRVDRQFARNILVDYESSTIEHFQGRRDLLYAFREAIQGHQNLWNAGILHGDINEGNIIIGTQSLLGGRAAVLIDLDLAIRVDHHSNGYFHENGTREFASINLLEFHERGRHEYTRDYLDDLESFFYLLCKICSTFTSPGTQVERMPDFVSQWDQADARPAALAKFNTLLCADYEVTPYFGPIVQTLLDKLHQFIASAAGRKRTMRLKRERRKEPPPSWADLRPAADRDYARVLGFINEAIEELTYGRFMEVYDPELEVTAERARAAGNTAYESPSAPTFDWAPPVFTFVAHPGLRRARDEDDLGYYVPPPKRHRGVLVETP